MTSDAITRLRQRYAAERQGAETFVQWVKRQPRTFAGEKLRKLMDAEYEAIMRGDDAAAEAAGARLMPTWNATNA